MGVGMRLVRGLAPLSPEDKVRVWDAEVEQLQTDVRDRLKEGRGVLGVAGPELPAALEAGLEPILCVGESEQARDAGETEAVLERQLAADLAGLDPSRVAAIVVAYEPIWAIGTGRTATAEQAQQACAFIRDVLRMRGGAGERVRILYGGSVKPANAAELLALPDVDGALVGGASLDAEEFAAIVEAAG